MPWPTSSSVIFFPDFLSLFTPFSLFLTKLSSHWVISHCQINRSPPDPGFLFLTLCLGISLPSCWNVKCVFISLRWYCTISDNMLYDPLSSVRLNSSLIPTSNTEHGFFICLHSSSRNYLDFSIHSLSPLRTKTCMYWLHDYTNGYLGPWRIFFFWFI